MIRKAIIAVLALLALATGMVWVVSSRQPLYHRMVTDDAWALIGCFEGSVDLALDRGVGLLEPFDRRTMIPALNWNKAADSTTTPTPSTRSLASTDPKTPAASDAKDSDSIKFDRIDS